MRSDDGFTLIEVLLVVFIIGLASSVVVMSVPTGPSAAQQEAIRLERTLDALSDRAVLSGDIYALDLGVRQYEALRWSEGDWVELDAGAYDLPDGVRLSVRGDPSRDDIWRVMFDPAGLPPETFIDVVGPDERRQIERVRQTVGTEQ